MLPFTTKVRQQINKNVHELQLCLVLCRRLEYKYGCYSLWHFRSYADFSCGKAKLRTTQRRKIWEHMSGLAELTQYQVTQFQTYICHYFCVIYLEFLTNEICFLSFYPLSLIKVHIEHRPHYSTETSNIDLSQVIYRQALN